MSAIVVRGQLEGGSTILRLVVNETAVAAAIEVDTPHGRKFWTFVIYVPGPTAQLDAHTEAGAREWLEWIGSLVDEKRCRVAT